MNNIAPIVSISVQDEAIKNKLASLAKISSEFQRRRLVVGTNIKYMKKHQLGDGVPTRRFLGISTQDKEIILDILQTAITENDQSAQNVLEEIGEYMLIATDDRFKTETDPEGRKWRPLAPWTIAEKRALGRIQKILQSTGTGRGSIRYQVL